MEPLAFGKWAGDDEVLGVGWNIAVIAVDRVVVHGRTEVACWIRTVDLGTDYPMYRSCDIGELELSDSDQERLYG